MNSVGYDEQSQILEIEFTGGEVYRYLDVPASVFHELMSVNRRDDTSTHRFAITAIDIGGSIDPDVLSLNLVKRI